MFAVSIYFCISFPQVVSEIGLRMKTRPERGGIVKNITIKDWTMTGCATAGIHIITNYSSNPGGAAAPTLPICRNITVENVTVDSTSYRGFYIVGQSRVHITNLLFKNCAFNGTRQNTLTYVDYMTFTGCTIPGSFSLSNCTNIIQN